MNAIEIMNEEHRYITRMLKVVRKVSFRILKGEDVNYDDFNSIIDFISNYADRHHHKKEEDILFNKMIEHIGEIAEKFVKQGMLVEHDFGRLYMRDLEQALVRLKSGDEEAKLDVISNAISYTHLLERHIDKEDRVIYKFAQRELNEEVLNLIDKECREYEANNLQEKDRCISVLEKLERKYI
ncbi:MAG: hemerythrin domain-containing protein [Paraclostridium sp.]|uniref:hemerythrin domain-containing protein n=1 Tax=Paraclostridium TaxID=1849822 RepID=UPI001CC3DDA7|nr:MULTISPECIES: hemerythrin domain-containing protein [Paraclostridium]MBZ6006955.1 hemerythrin domain-containing protein [Paraclostridium bifermentans]MDU0296996.1 hemerythrin domain-containing protein [Paraclostridium sp. MRS3W1]